MRYTCLLLLSIFLSSCRPGEDQQPVPVVSALGLHEFKGHTGVADAVLCADGRILVLTSGNPAEVIGINADGSLWFKTAFTFEDVIGFSHIAEGADNGFVVLGSIPFGGTDSSGIRLVGIDKNANRSWLAKPPHTLSGFSSEMPLLLRTRSGNYVMLITEIAQMGVRQYMSWCDASGNILRSTQSFPNNLWSDISEMEDGNIMLTGIGSDANFSTPVILHKLSAQGDVIWEKGVDQDIQIEQIGNVLPLPGGELVLCGSNATDTPPFGRFPFMMKISATGDLLWRSYYKAPGRYGAFYDITADGSGGYTAVGTSIDSIGMFSQVDLVSVAADGTEQWRKKYDVGNHVKKIFSRPDGGYTIIGDGAAGTGGFFVLITDKDGNIE